MVVERVVRPVWGATAELLPAADGSRMLLRAGSVHLLPFAGFPPRQVCLSLLGTWRGPGGE